MTSHLSRSYTLKTCSARQTPCVPSTAIVRTLCVATVTSRRRSRARFFLFALSLKVSVCSASPPPFTRQPFPPLCDFFNFPSFPITVLALYFLFATWVQPSHPASLRPSSVSGANLMLTHRLLSFLPLSAAVRQFGCHGRWYERSDLWIQLAVHRRCHRLCRYDHSTPGLLTVSSLTSTVWDHLGREAARARRKERESIMDEVTGVTQEEGHTFLLFYFVHSIFAGRCLLNFCLQSLYFAGKLPG